jgi:hypothetical protein
MKTKISSAATLLCAFAFVATGLSRAEDVKHSNFGRVEQWVVSEVAKSHEGSTPYEAIPARPGDRILVAAGGCLQTPKMNCALIAIPGLPEMEVHDFLNRYREGFVIHQNRRPLRIQVRYETNADRDEMYAPAGYRLAKPCERSGNGWVGVTIIHP